MPRVDFNKAACYQNPVLDPDAWSMVENNKPYDDGIYAVLVCRFSCPIAEMCPFDGDGNEIIVRGGWFNSAGVFKAPTPDMIDMNQAAAYIGITPVYLRSILGDSDAFQVQRNGNRNFIRVKDMMALAKEYGPRHGSPRMLKLHHIRGERPCHTCLNPQEVQDAEPRAKKKRQRVQI